MCPGCARRAPERRDIGPRRAYAVDVEGIEVLWLVYEWLPRVFVLDVLLFHFVADHPLAMRCWTWRPPGARARAVGTSAVL
jgi:hypothetical protein